MEFDVNKFNDVTDCIIAIEKLKRRKKELTQKDWKQKYSKICEDNFCELELALFSLNFSAKDRNMTHEEEVALCNKVLNVFYEQGKPTISALTNILYDLGLNIDNNKLSKMICSACVCNGCRSCLWVDKYNKTGKAPDENEFTTKEIREAIHCNGYSCMKCQQNSFKGYDWVCDE